MTTESAADGCFNKKVCRKRWPKETLDGADATMRAIREVLHDGLSGRGMKFE